MSFVTSDVCLDCGRLICFPGFLFLQVYGGKGEQKHRHIQFGGSAQQVYPFHLFIFKNFLKEKKDSQL